MPRLTAAGWLVVAGGVLMLGAGRALAIIELLMLGTGALSLVGASALLSRRSTPRLTVRRELSRRRVHAGSSVGVRVSVTNRGRRRTPVLELAEPVGERAARLLVAPLDSDAWTDSRYSLSAGRRGRLGIGPLTSSAVDPFGLARATTTVEERTEIIVLPHVDVVRPLPRTPALDTVPHSGRARLVGSGGEFHSLAQYQPGDDLRRVHWPSSLRRDDLYVRVDEQPWDGVTTVVLDDASAAPDELYEHAVSAAASVLTAAARAGHRCRLVTARGHDSGFGVGTTHADRMLRHLALVEPGPGRWGAALVAAARSGGAVAAVAPVTLDGAGVRHALSRAGLVVTVGPGGTVTLGPGFPAGWDAAVLRARAPQGAAP